MSQLSEENLNLLIPIIIIAAIWELIWKLIAMWKAGRNNHLSMFIFLALFNTVGILPIIYLLRSRKRANQ